jgi:hypothetical protein
VALQAVEARTAAGLDDRPDVDGGVAEHHGQVRDVAPEPQPVQLGREHEVPDGDREVTRVRPGRLGVGRDAHRETDRAERLRDTVDRGPAAGDGDRLGGCRQGSGERGGHEGEQRVDVGLARPGRAADHGEARTADARAERSDDALVGRRHVVEHHDGRRHSELEARGRAPDERIPRIEFEHHAHEGATMVAAASGLSTRGDGPTRRRCG